jgi:hypothetical protein
MSKAVLMLTSLFLLFFIFSCKKEKAVIVEDIVVAAPDKVEVLLDNQYVKVTKFMLKPDDTLPMHKGGPRTIYSLSDYTLKWKEGAEEEVTKNWQAGDVHWHDATPHAAENTGNSDAQYLVLTRKAQALPGVMEYDINEDASKADSAHSKVLYDDENVRVVEVNLEPGAKQFMHHGINRIIYSLTNYTINYQSGENEPVENTFAAGDCHWHGADAHSVENIGDTAANYLIFSFKK